MSYDVCFLGFGPGGPQLEARLWQAYSAWLCSLGGKILFFSSDTTRFGQPVTEWAKGELLRLKVPCSSIVVEPYGSNTREEILRALEISDQPICFVTSWYHIPRVRLIARRATKERELLFASTREGTRAHDYVQEVLAWGKLFLRLGLGRK